MGTTFSNEIETTICKNYAQFFQTKGTPPSPLSQNKTEKEVARKYINLIFEKNRQLNFFYIYSS